MKCRIDDCNRDSMYKKKQLCQMHYFRIMRNGVSDIVNTRKYRQTQSTGYQLLDEPNHPMAQAGGYVYEHRLVLFNKLGYSITSCDLCGNVWSWDDLYKSHVDHIDEDRTNNDISNLRPLCNSCNTRRNPKIKEHSKKGRIAVEYDGVTMTPNEWDREDFVPVEGYVIRNRIKRGWSVVDALTWPSQKQQVKELETRL